MSKKAIDDLLDGLIKHIKENEDYRSTSDTMEHLYEVSAVDIAKQLRSQLGILIQTLPKFKTDKLDILAQEYAMALHAEFSKEVARTDNRRKVTFAFHKESKSPTDFVVQITQKGSNEVNIFAIINKVRTNSTVIGKDTVTKIDKKVDSPLNTLRSGIMKEVLGNNTSTYAKDVVYGGRHEKDGIPILDKHGKEIRHGGLLQLGHAEASSIAEKRVVLSLEHLEESLTGLGKIKARSSGPGTTKPKSTISLKAMVESFISIERNKHFEVTIEQTTVRDESSSANTSKGSKEEKELISKLANSLAKELRAVDWINQKGSRSAKQIIVSELITASLKGDKKAKVKADFPNAKEKNTKDKYTSTPKVLKSTKQVTRSKETLGNATNLKGAITKPKGADKKFSGSQNWSSIIAIINTKLADRIKGNMSSPKLVNRTGRFAESAKVTSVETSAQGYPSFVFDYQRNPYEVFDRVNGRSPWNTPNRDPKSLIALSVREIAQELAIGRFYTRRA